MDLELTAASEKDILENTIASTVTYAAGHGPVDVRVVDPLRVPDANFELRVGSLTGEDVDLEDAARHVLDAHQLVAPQRHRSR